MSASVGLASARERRYGVAEPATADGRRGNVAADRSFRNAPAGDAEQHHLRRCDDAARLRSAEGQQVSRNAPAWIDLVHVYAQPVIALTISFVVAGLFWFSHHRRLAVAPEGSRGVVFLNLIFLLSIIILPVTNGLYGGYRLDSVVAVIYGVHLTIIAGAECAAVGSRAARPPRSRIAGNRALPGLRVRVRNSDGRRRADPLRNSPGAWRLSRRWRAGWRRAGGR